MSQYSSKGLSSRVGTREFHAPLAERNARATSFSIALGSTEGQKCGSDFPAIQYCESTGQIPVPWWKRAFDIAFIILIAPAVLLIFLIIGLHIKLASRGPVFFKQKRIGRNGKPFLCFKFRTMHLHNNEQVHRDYYSNLIGSNQPMTKLDALGDPRLIPGGGLLRSSGLDELPQLINVLRGEMSIVGPRPCTPYEYEMYQPHHKHRLLALPGLTGLWQVSGKNRTTFETMVRLDITYARTQSIGNDLRIILKTMPTLFGQVSNHVAARKLGRPIKQAQPN